MKTLLRRKTKCGLPKNQASCVSVIHGCGILKHVFVQTHDSLSECRNMKLRNS